MRKPTIVLLIFVTLFSFACAQDEPTVPEAPDVTPEATGSPAASGELEYNDEGTETFTEQDFDVEMALDNFYFEPTFIKSPGDATAMITLTNEGDVAHTFTSDALDFDEELQPGDSKEIEVAIGTETRYEFYCRFHQGQGMRGAFQPH
ncbi:MAG: cupredoxin domain-containing protein [Actinomycetota bacterium]